MIVVGTTLAAYVMDNPDHWRSWMKNANAVRNHYPHYGVRYFAAIEVDKRGIEPFNDFIVELEKVGGEYWTYSLDDGRTEVTTKNRLRHITAGQNLVTDYAVSTGASHLLFLAADCMPQDDIIPRMLEMEHPFCAPFIPTYCLTGPLVKENLDGMIYPWPVMEAMPSAACVFIARSVFKRLRWRWDFEDGSDDPCYYLDARELLGIEAHVRKDVRAYHFPEAVGPIESRGHDMRVHR